MKKKLLPLVVCAAVLLSACNIIDVTEVGSINGEPILKSQYLFYLEQGKMMAMNAAQQQGQTITQSSDWTKVFIEGETANEYAKNKAKEFLKESAVMKVKAAEVGLELTEEDLSTIENYKAQLIEQYGGRYEYRQNIKSLGLSDEDLTELATDAVYANKLWQQYSEEDEGFASVSDEEVMSDYKERFVMAKHILIQPDEGLGEIEVDEEADEEMITEEKTFEELDAEAREKAQDILNRLLAGENFDKLMNEFSQDPGLESNPDGYLFTTGQMVPEFEEAAFALGEGEMNGELVKSDHGYHIIKKEEVPTAGEEYENAIEPIRNELLSKKIENMINTWAQEMDFTFNDAVLDKIKITMQ